MIQIQKKYFVTLNYRKCYDNTMTISQVGKSSQFFDEHKSNILVADVFLHKSSSFKVGKYQTKVRLNRIVTSKHFRKTSLDVKIGSFADKFIQRPTWTVNYEFSVTRWLYSYPIFDLLQQWQFVELHKMPKLVQKYAKY